MDGVQGADDLDDVISAQQGDDRAFSALFDRWFDRVHDVAFHIVHDPAVAAEVAQDVFLNAWQKLDTLRDPAAFGGWLLRSARNRALNRREFERRSTPTGGEEIAMEHDRRRPPLDLPAMAYDLDQQQQLLWAASSALGERDASILSLHLRHGLDAPELADELGVTANNAHQMLFRLRDRLGEAIGAWMVWRQGSPRCEELKQVLDRDGLATFDRTTASAVKKHLDWCVECAEERRQSVAPAAVFAGIPVLVAPAILKTEVAAALESQGVPLQSSHASSAGDPTGVLPASRGAELDSSGGLRSQATQTNRRMLMAVGAAAVVLLILFFATRALDEGTDADQAATGLETTSTTAASTTSSQPTTTTSQPVPPPPPPPSTVTDPTTSSTVDPGPAPTLTAFRVFRSTTVQGCATPSEGVRIAWSATDATEVLVTGPGAPADAQPATGDLGVCAAGPGTFQVFANGPGGTTPSDEVTV